MAYEERQYGSLSCLVSVPPGDPPDNGWPVLVFLHGRDEAAPTPIGVALTRHGPLRPGSAPAATNQFVVVAPQLPAPGGDVWASQADRIAELATAVVRDYQGDPSRVYLTGFSYGGNGVLDVGSRRPDVWAALWPVDPPSASASRGNQAIWVSAGPYSRARKSGFVGAQDRQPQTPSPQQRVYDDAGRDHVGTAVTAYSDSAIYQWLLTHRSGRQSISPGAPPGA